MLVLCIVYAHTSWIACPCALGLVAIVKKLATTSAATCAGDSAWLYARLRRVLTVVMSWWLLMTRVRICLHQKNGFPLWLVCYELCGGSRWYCYSNESRVEWKIYCQCVLWERMSLRYLYDRVLLLGWDSTFGESQSAEQNSNYIWMDK